MGAVVGLPFQVTVVEATSFSSDFLCSESKSDLADDVAVGL